MADVKPLKLVDQGGGAARLSEFETGDTLPKAALPALSAADVGAVAADDPRLSDAREWNAATIPQTDAEGGTAQTRRAWTAQRVRQAIVAWWNSVSSAWGRGFVASADDAAGRTALNCANKSGDTLSGTHDYGAGNVRFTGTIGAGVVSRATSSGGLRFSSDASAAGHPSIDFDGVSSDGSSTLNVRFFRSLNTSGGGFFELYRADGTSSLAHRISSRGLVTLNRLEGETVIGATTSNGVDRLQVTGSIIATGAIKLATFTLATLPSAAANIRGQVYCSDLAGQAAPVFSDGTNWRRVSDNTIAN